MPGRYDGADKSDAGNSGRGSWLSALFKSVFLAYDGELLLIDNYLQFKLHVQEQHLCNGKVRDMFYSIPCVRNMIAARQMDFVGKMIRGPPDCLSRNMITACCDHKCRVGRPQTTGKNFMVENLRLLFQDIPTVQIDRHGSLRSWIHEASNEKYWCQLVKNTSQAPGRFFEGVACPSASGRDPARVSNQNLQLRNRWVS